MKSLYRIWLIMDPHFNAKDGSRNVRDGSGNVGDGPEMFALWSSCGLPVLLAAAVAHAQVQLPSLNKFVSVALTSSAETNLEIHIRFRQRCSLLPITSPKLSTNQH